jgi:hypothetical protein
MVVHSFENDATHSRMLALLAGVIAVSLQVGLPEHLWFSDYHAAWYSVQEHSKRILPNLV